jgi:hypothetical protein
MVNCIEVGHNILLSFHFTTLILFALSKRQSHKPLHFYAFGPHDRTLSGTSLLHSTCCLQVPHLHVHTSKEFVKHEFVIL